VLYDLLSPFLALLPLTSSSDEASISSFDEEEEVNCQTLRILELVNLPLGLELLKLRGELLHVGVL
jgi:hypothetical protein